MVRHIYTIIPLSKSRTSLIELKGNEGLISFEIYYGG